MSLKSYDPVWNDIYDSGNHPRSPYDFIASFVFRHVPKDKPRQDVKVLEIGCGSGSNLWFLALEGFNVSGIDGSESAIEAGRERLAEYQKSGDLRVGDFTALPFEDGEFDLVFDRGALTCCGTESMSQAITEVHRVLKSDGCFFYNPIADSDTSYRSGEQGNDDVTVNIQDGDYQEVGQIRFVSRREIDDFLPSNLWQKGRVERVEIVDMLNPHGKITASWRVEAIKK